MVKRTLYILLVSLMFVSCDDSSGNVSNSDTTNTTASTTEDNTTSTTVAVEDNVTQALQNLVRVIDEDSARDEDSNILRQIWEECSANFGLYSADNINGLAILSGTDSDSDGFLSAEEASYGRTSILCNGADGQIVANTTPLFESKIEDQCPNSNGLAFSVAYDENGNGVLDTNEVGINNYQIICEAQYAEYSMDYYNYGAVMTITTSQITSNIKFFYPKWGQIDENSTTLCSGAGGFWFENLSPDSQQDVTVAQLRDDEITLNDANGDINITICNGQKPLIDEIVSDYSLLPAGDNSECQISGGYKFYYPEGSTIGQEDRYICNLIEPTIIRFAGDVTKEADENCSLSGGVQIKTYETNGTVAETTYVCNGVDGNVSQLELNMLVSNNRLIINNGDMNLSSLSVNELGDEYITTMTLQTSSSCPNALYEIRTFADKDRSGTYTTGDTNSTSIKVCATEYSRMIDVLDAPTGACYNSGYQLVTFIDSNGDKNYNSGETVEDNKTICNDEVVTSVVQNSNSASCNGYDEYNITKFIDNDYNNEFSSGDEQITTNSFCALRTSVPAAPKVDLVEFNATKFTAADTEVYINFSFSQTMKPYTVTSNGMVTLDCGGNVAGTVIHVANGQDFHYTFQNPGAGTRVCDLTVSEFVENVDGVPMVEDNTTAVTVTIN